MIITRDKSKCLIQMVDYRYIEKTENKETFLYCFLTDFHFSNLTYILKILILPQGKCIYVEQEYLTSNSSLSKFNLKMAGSNNVHVINLI